LLAKRDRSEMLRLKTNEKLGFTSEEKQTEASCFGGPLMFGVQIDANMSQEHKCCAQRTFKYRN